MPSLHLSTPELRDLPFSLRGRRQEHDEPGTVRFPGAPVAHCWLFALRRDGAGRPVGIAWIAREAL
jgi:hypothetical protein